ncbi:MAG: hypothetical protein AAGB34_05450, partial [Planctomycetota bacterium]
MNELVSGSFGSLSLQFPFVGWSKRLCASLCSTQPAFFDLNRGIQQIRIASNRHSSHLNLGLNRTVLRVTHGCFESDSGFGLAWRQRIMGGMWSQLVIPVLVGIKTRLQRFGTWKQERSACPGLERSVDSLDLRVELPMSEAAPGVFETVALNSSFESTSELAPTIGN